MATIKEHGAMVWGERGFWVVIVLMAYAVTARWDKTHRPACPTPAPTGLAPEVRAYIDQKLGGPRAPASAASEADPGLKSRVQKIEEKITALDQTAELRLAALASCEAVHSEFRHLYDAQRALPEILRDQELARLRSRSAAACAGVPNLSHGKILAPSPGPRKFGTH